AGVAARFGEMITAMAGTGQLQQFFAGAFKTLVDLGAILGNIGSILTSVFSASSQGATLISTFVLLTGAAAEFLKSAEGTAGLNAIFGTMKTIVDSVLPSFKILAPVIGEIVGALGSTLG